MVPCPRSLPTFLGTVPVLYLPIRSSRNLKEDILHREKRRYSSQLLRSPSPRSPFPSPLSPFLSFLRSQRAVFILFFCSSLLFPHSNFLSPFPVAPFVFPFPFESFPETVSTPKKGEKREKDRENQRHIFSESRDPSPCPDNSSPTGLFVLFCLYCAKRSQARRMDVEMDMAGGMDPGASGPDSHGDHLGHDDGRGHGHGSHDSLDGLDGHDSPTNGVRLAEPRRRNRPALSCIQCRTRKIRCDRSEPCASCIKSKIVNCTYEEARRPKPRLWKLSPAPSTSPFRAVGGQAAEGPVVRLADSFSRDAQPPASTPAGLQYASSAASVPSVRTSDSASTSLPSPPGRYAESTTNGSSYTESLVRQIHQLEQEINELRRRDAVPLSSQSSQSTPNSHPAPTPTQPIINKTRYVGASHWMSDAKLVWLSSLPPPPLLLFLPLFAYSFLLH